jgi:hypothetical protein
MYVICVLTAVCPYGIAAQVIPSRYGGGGGGGGGGCGGGGDGGGGGNSDLFL